MNPAWIDPILHADQELFLFLNGQHSSIWDQVMKFITYKFTWIPMYVVLLYGIISRFQIRAVGYLLCIIAVIALSDQLASGFFKPYFMRPRPCYEPALAGLVHLVGGCGGPYGFISSHAATGFGIAVSVSLLPTRRLPGVRWLFLWALFYSYSRVYVGVHYPLDIFVGGLAGALVAWLVCSLYQLLAARTESRYF